MPLSFRLLVLRGHRVQSDVFSFQVKISREQAQGDFQGRVLGGERLTVS